LPAVVIATRQATAVAISLNYVYFACSVGYGINYSFAFQKHHPVSAFEGYMMYAAGTSQSVCLPFIAHLHPV
jgi:hypothetical protein